MFTTKQLVFATAVWIALAVSLPTLSARSFHGTVISSTGGQLALSAGGEDLRFYVAQDAQITIDGHEAELSDLTAGLEATVAAKREGNKWTATKIEARTQKNGAFRRASLEAFRQVDSPAERLVRRP